MAVIENLDVVLGAKTAKFDRGIGAAQNRASLFARTVGGLSSAGRGIAAAAGPALLGVAAAAATVGVAVGIATRKISQQMAEIDKIGKTSDKLGIAADHLVGLRLAAGEASGMSAAAVDTSLQRMTRRLSEGAGPAAAAVAELGLDVEALGRMTPDAAFREISTAMQDVNSQGDALRLSFALFGREGAGLVSTLRGGPEALQEATDWAKRFGLALSDAQVNQVEAANDAWARVGMITTGFWRTLAAESAPALLAISEGITGFAGDMYASAGGLDQLIQNIIEGVVGTIGWFIDLQRHVTAVMGTLGIMAANPIGFFTEDAGTMAQVDALTAGFNFGEFSAAEEMMSNIREHREAIAASDDDIAADRAAQANMSAEQDRLEKAEAMMKEFESPLAGLQGSVAEIRSLSDLMDVSSFQQAMAKAGADFASALPDLSTAADPLAAFAQLEGDASEALLDGLIDGETFDKIINDAKRQMDVGLFGEDAVRQAEQLRESMKSPEQQLDERLASLQSQFEGGLINSEEMNALANKAVDEVNPDEKELTRGDGPQALKFGTVAAFEAARKNDRAANEQLTIAKKHAALSAQANEFLSKIAENVQPLEAIG